MASQVCEHITLKGSYFDIGYQHGVACKSAVQNFLNQDVAQINWLINNKIDGDDIQDLVAPYKAALSDQLPELIDELKGLAEGAGVTLDQAVLLQIRRELIGTNGFTLMGDCSSFAYRDSNDRLSGQTIDLNGDMTSLGRVFHIMNENRNIPEIMMYSFAGLLGYMGMNNAGLTVVINLVISDHWKVGITPYTMVRKFLEFRTVDECIDFAKSISVASSRSFTISDVNRTVTMELTGSEVGIMEGEALYHTNHYLYEPFLEEDRINFFSRNSSIKRIRLMEEHFQSNGHSVECAKEIFKSEALFPAGICAHNEGDVKLNETVAAVIMEPNKGRMHVLKGKTCEEEYTVFEFKKEMNTHEI